MAKKNEIGKTAPMGKAEAAAARLPVLARREENRNGVHPFKLTGKSLTVENECNAELRRLNYIVMGLPNPEEKGPLS